MNRHFTAFVVACGVAVSLAAAHALRQNPQQAPPAKDRPSFRTDINLVLVDVHVTSGGRPVTDLTADDVRVLENGAAQRIATFEYVRMEAPQSAVPMEPSSVRASLDLAADPRNRVFVLFLDAFHVTEVDSLQIPTALVNAIDRLIAPTDLVGAMTPHTAASELVLGRKTDVIRPGLLDNRRWGRKVENCRSVHVLEEIELTYAACYPPPPGDPPCDLSPTAMELIRLRRESFTLGALRDAVRYIGANREARTAFILVSEGWPLRRPSRELTNLSASSPPQIRIGPGGRLGTQNAADFAVDKGLCDRHLHAAAQLDNHRTFLDLIDDANRNNASFYIVDPGGLRVEGGYVDTLRTLADNTNGEAIVDRNDLGGALQRALENLSGYYLIGYYSTNSTPDGRYRSIKVDVARPRVEVRARKGYRAWTAEEVKGRAARAAAAAAPPDPGTVERTAAHERLARLNPATPFYLHGTVGPAGSALYVSGELASAAARDAEWRGGGEAQILVTAPDGSSAGTARATIAPGGRSFHIRIPVGRNTAPGEYEVAVRLKPAGGSGPLLEIVRIGASGGGMGEPLAFRSANRTQPVATFLWSRTESAHLEAPVTPDAASPAARLLDRAGSPIPVPIDASIREDADGRWIVAALTLAPLSPGDYTVELTVVTGGGTARRLAPLRVGR